MSPKRQCLERPSHAHGLWKTTVTQDSENIMVHRRPVPFLNEDRRVVDGDGGRREWSG